MQINRVTDLASLQQFHHLKNLTLDHDYDRLPGVPIEELLPRHEQPQSATDRVERFLAEEAGHPVGILDLRYPLVENRSGAHLDLVVHPDHRARGLGRELLAFGIAEGQRFGRTRFYLETPSLDGDDSDGDGDGPAACLLKQAGAIVGQTARRRLLDLSGPLIPAAAVPPDYRLVHYPDRAPEELAAGVAHLLGRMTTDTPQGELSVEPEHWNVARLRDHEAELVAQNRRRITTAAVHVQTGVVAGVTDLVFAVTDPGPVGQWSTIVAPDHRGHRLGLVLKGWNHRYLLEQSPAARFITTWNAESNTYMVSVNEALGFQPMERWTEWQLDL